MSIHPTAVIDKGAQIGKNVKIGPFSCIEADTVIHDDVVLGAQVT
ncbi:MAG: acyl-[acyl-carrier-protein]--UDP-N-acetylglucosamine O-acyltransferase, partial [bacterium]